MAEKGQELAEVQMTHMTEQLVSFKQNLEQFAAYVRVGCDHLSVHVLIATALIVWLSVSCVLTAGSRKTFAKTPSFANSFKNSVCRLAWTLLHVSQSTLCNIYTSRSSKQCQPLFWLLMMFMVISGLALCECSTQRVLGTDAEHR